MNFEGTHFGFEVQSVARFDTAATNDAAACIELMEIRKRSVDLRRHFLLEARHEFPRGEAMGKAAEGAFSANWKKGEKYILVVPDAAMLSTMGMIDSRLWGGIHARHLLFYPHSKENLDTIDAISAADVKKLRDSWLQERAPEPEACEAPPAK